MILYHIDNYEVTKKKKKKNEKRLANRKTQFVYAAAGLRIKGVVWRELKQKKATQILSLLLLPLKTVFYFSAFLSSSNLGGHHGIPG